MIDDAVKSVAAVLSEIPNLKVFPHERNIQSMSPGQGTVTVHQAMLQSTMGLRGNQTVRLMLTIMLRGVVSSSTRRVQNRLSSLLSMSPTDGIMGKLKSQRGAESFWPRCESLSVEYMKGDADIALTMLVGYVDVQIPYSS